ncbi:hypothetical protein PQQ51_33135 [Paraburkholderia xenovorans]|uniref:hypothetical protein n=1 Tax=Paraburkholderia xenovorans TaxID=36873 RepID=UPI0038B7D65C
MSDSVSLLSVVRDSIYFDNLLSRAKDAIATYAAQTWTDKGEHDPGITFLEGFSYSVSDLAYRNTLPLTDLLTPPVENQIVGDGVFPADFGPQMALTSGPVTPDDYRRALLDLYDTEGQYFYFRNVQLVCETDDYTYWYDTYATQFSFQKPTPIDGSTPMEFELRGNYTLYVEPSRDTQANNTAAQAALDAFLTDNRNIGESVSQVVWTKPQMINPVALIELDDNVQDFVSIYAAIYEATGEFISPKAARYTTEACEEQGLRSEDICVGPYLQYGWIPELPTEVDYTQQVSVNLGGLAKVWLAIDGIKSIVSLREHANADNVWTWTSKANQTYVQLWGSDPLSVLVNSVQLVTAGGVYVSVSPDDIQANLSPETIVTNSAVVLPYGQSRNVAQYHPVSDKIPPCYGLQQFPASAAESQLYQYLLPFEQAIANGCQQLSMLPQLLSFTRNGYTVWGAQWPYATDSIGDRVHATYSDSLINQIKNNSADYNQELAILNYLLGYFGTQRASRMLDTSTDEFLAVEHDYLAEITTLAYNRANIRVDQVSSLQKRIAARLGFGEGLFADKADMGNLPFYLVEHRALLPEQPSSDYDAPSYPTSAALSADGQSLVITAASSQDLSNLLVGQLIDMVLVGGLSPDNGDDDFTLQALIVDQVDAGAKTFNLDIQNNPQIGMYTDQIIAAQSAGKLYWQNCQVWLHEIEYPLQYASDQTGAPSDGKILTVPASFPFPALVRQGDTLLINAIHPPGITNTVWSLKVVVQGIDDIAGTLTVAKAGGETNDFPDEADETNYYWIDQNTVDRFSFIVSLVLNKATLPTSGDPYTTELWIKQCVQAELPAHVSIVIHWLDDKSTTPSNYFSFQSFAQSYASWQDAETAPSTSTYQLLWMLSLGRLPSRLIGIGAMIVATQGQQTDVIGSSGDEWNVSVIVEDNLFFVPKEYTPS